MNAVSYADSYYDQAVSQSAVMCVEHLLGSEIVANAFDTYPLGRSAAVIGWKTPPSTASCCSQSFLSGFLHQSHSPRWVVFADGLEDIPGDVRDFLGCNPDQQKRFSNARSLALNFYSDSKLDFDILRDPTTGSEYVCITIFTSEDFEAAMGRIGEFKQNWEAAIGEKYKRDFSFALV
jgi:hypothetical protein